MPTFSLIDVAGGSPLPGFAGEAVQAAKNAMCSLYNDHPGWFLTADTFGIRRSVLDSFCPRPPLPPPTPTAPCRAKYQITTRFRKFRPFSQSVCEEFEDPVPQVSELWGPITATRYVGYATATVGSCAGRTGFNSAEVLCYGGGTAPLDSPIWVPVATDGVNSIISLTTFEIVPLTAQTNCVPFTFPVPIDRTPPPPSALDRTVPIPVGGGPVINIPLVYVDSLADVNIRFNVGPVQVNFDLGGVDVLPNPDFNFYTNPLPGSPAPPTLPPNYQPPGGPPDLRPSPPPRTPIETGSCPDYTELLNAIRANTDKIPDLIEKAIDVQATADEILEFLKQKFPEYEFVARQLEEASSFIFNEPFIHMVFLNMIQVPENAKTQYGGLVAPDVFYAGWYDVGEINNRGDRKPINYLRQVFYPQSETALGFSATLYEGFTAAVTVIVRREKQ